MPARIGGPGVMKAVLSGERDGPTMKLTLECKHVARLTRRGTAFPAQARCFTCKPVTCGATNRDGGACALDPKHRDLQHELNGRRWSYDARTLATANDTTGEGR